MKWRAVSYKQKRFPLPDHHIAKNLIFVSTKGQNRDKRNFGTKFLGWIVTAISYKNVFQITKNGKTINKTFCRMTLANPC